MTLPPRWRRVSGDVGDTLVAVLDGVDTLDGVTAVEGHVWRWVRDDGTPRVTLAAAVTNAAAREVTVQLGGVGGWLPTASPGSWLFELEVTSGGVTRTWPEGPPAVIDVRAQGD